MNLPLIAVGSRDSMLEFTSQRILTVIKRHSRPRVGIAAGSAISSLLRHLILHHGRRFNTFSHLSLVLVDERDVETNSSERNAIQIAALLDELSITFPLSLVGPETETSINATLETYSKIIASLLPFHVCLLSLGDDGHVAGIFDGCSTTTSTNGVCMYSSDAPKGPPGRFSVSLMPLQRAGCRILLVFGHEKQRALKDFLCDPTSIARRWSPTHVIVDEAALPDGIDPRLVRRGG